MIQVPLSRKLQRIRNPHCEECPLHHSAGHVCVVGDGSGRIPVLVLGEAPGYDEDRLGRPFVGRAGKLLRSELLKVGLQPPKLYLTNVAKCYPKGTPTDSEADICAETYLRREVEILDPKFILSLGRVAMNACMDSRGLGITKARGKIYQSKICGALVMPVFHPAYVLRRQGTSDEAVWKDDLKLFGEVVKLDLGL